MQVETWKAILGFNGIYEVSSLGNIRSLTRKVRSKNGSWYKKTGVILKPTLTPNGYLKVSLVSSFKKTANIHRLVAKAFIVNFFNFKEVNHKNGIKTDNRVENLEWCSRSINMSHAYEIGIHCQKRGRNNAAKKVINNQSGELYLCVTDAAISVGMKRETLVAMLVGRNRNKTNLSYFQQDGI